MNSLLHLVDVVSMAVIWWCAAAALAGGHEVRDFRNLVVGIGLIGAMVFSFTGAISLLLQPDLPRPVWGCGLRVAVALVAGGFYEYRFGVVRHLRMLFDWMSGVFRRRRQA